ncbi:MAG: ribosomal protein S18-alanine N-acetyltransferase [Ostreibacterium sp.]
MAATKSIVLININGREVMLVFAIIPENYLSDMLVIEARSNRHAWSPSNLSNSYQQYHHFGAFRDKQLVAFLLYQEVLDEVEVIHLVCDQSEQGKGYAYQLFSQFIQGQQDKGISTFYLEVRESNQRAKQLYQHLGFAEIGRRKTYYQQREDAILMKWSSALKLLSQQ